MATEEEAFLENLREDCAATILKISRDDRTDEEKLKAFKGLIWLNVVRAQQIEKGLIRAPFNGDRTIPLARNIDIKG